MVIITKYHIDEDAAGNYMYAAKKKAVARYADITSR
jgi:hypothetical protein